MTLPEPAFLAVDWGTTNRRVYAIDATGAVVARERDDRGVLGVAAGAFPAEVEAIRARMGPLPMLCAGMVGSTRGWVEVPYLPCPAGFGDLAAGLHRIDARTAIVPGLSSTTARGGDVMRGEEVQLLGSVVAGMAPADALLCQPGTHCKWARLAGGSVTGFRTTMTGELFALLKRHSLLSDFLSAEPVDGAAFREGVAAAQDATLLGDLFGVRANILLGHRARADAASYVSGLLIGSDVREQAIAPGEHVHVLADPGLGALYGVALSLLGASPVLLDSAAAFVAGMTHIWRHDDAFES
ncbi:2-dehydro-3-deoxygalactonokinase [Sphingomonas solaris]|uniref:2-dehydro-3-deoxygalactonokinase n=1 Tax=Alterirhizorhabdus solaris TaxID=2529389 RepID=A0A558QVG7_9SPHN|nr:2-dehydro-3-deoxygalactonokinase [Sphingomonas solaris]TVV71115.1 2-dehydro-3-deoxygalactonokinase [Sphingomonas solaris]